MSGNVWEWCEDTFNNNYYERSPENNPCNTENGNYKCVRGGSCTKKAATSIIYYRDSGPGNKGHIDLGFRVCKDSKIIKKDIIQIVDSIPIVN